MRSASERTLLAEHAGPPRRKFTLDFMPGQTADGDWWRLSIWTYDDQGQEVRWRDYGDPTLRELLPTIVKHTASDLIWIDAETNAQIATDNLPDLDR